MIIDKILISIIYDYLGKVAFGLASSMARACDF